MGKRHGRAAAGLMTRLMGAVATLSLVGACGAGSASPSEVATPNRTPTTPVSPAPSVEECEAGYPSRNITWIVPYSPGGGFDTWSRLVAPYMEEYLPGQPSVVVENRSGAGGLVGVTQLYGSSPDGYTIAITEPGVLVTSQIAGTTEIDPSRLRAVGQLTVSPEVIVVSGDSPWASIEDVRTASSNQPVKMAHGGVAAINVVAFDALGIAWEGIFHEGSSEAILSIIRGDTDIAVFPLTSMLESIEAGDLKPLVVVGTKPASPDQPGYEHVVGVPTLDEVTGRSGIGAALEQHRLVVAPPDTPNCVVTILSDALQASLADPELVAQATNAGLVPVPLDAAAAQGIISNTVATLTEYADLIREKVGAE